MKKNIYFSILVAILYFGCSKEEVIDEVKLLPEISSFSPNIGSPGTLITIKGNNLRNTIAVKFGDVNAESFTVVDDKTLTAKVGSGASGEIKIITKEGTANLTGFIYKPVTKIELHSLILNVPGISGSQYFSVNGSVSGTRLYVKDGVEHLLISPTLFFEEPLIPAIHLAKKNGKWVQLNSYLEGAMGAGRQSEILDDAGTIIFADFGLELRNGVWPAGNIVMAKTIGETLKWNVISKERSFYHSLSIGDLNNDGLKDIIGLSFGSKGSWREPLHPYIQQVNGEFKEDRTFITYNPVLGQNGGCVLIANVMGDAKPEIIQADYNPVGGVDRYSFIIYKFNPLSNKYEFEKTPGVAGFASTNGGATSMRAVDIDKDGDLDIVLASEINTDSVGFEIWNNTGNGDFVFSNQKIEFKNTELNSREFEVVDIDEDGFQDILFNPTSGSKFKNVEFGTGTVFLHNMLWKNNRGKFEVLTKEQRIDLNSVPVYMKAFVINKKPKYIGIRCNIDGTLQITEIEPVF